MLKKIALAGATIAFLSTPFISSALTLSELQAQVQALMAQVQSMQPQAGSSVLIAPTTSSKPDDYGTGNTSSGIYCPLLSITMQRSARDATTNGQVSELQAFLTDYYDLNDGTVNGGFFGKLTEKYLIQFQSGQGLPAFGIAGQLTRAKIASVCGGEGASSSTKPIAAIDQSSLIATVGNIILTGTVKNTSNLYVDVTTQSGAMVIPWIPSVVDSSGHWRASGDNLPNVAAGVYTVNVYDATNEKKNFPVLATGTLTVSNSQPVSGNRNSISVSQIYRRTISFSYSTRENIQGVFLVDSLTGANVATISVAKLVGSGTITLPDSALPGLYRLTLLGMNAVELARSSEVRITDETVPASVLSITANGAIIGSNIPFNTAATIKWSSQNVKTGSCKISVKLPNGSVAPYRNSGSLADDNGSATTGILPMAGVYIYTLNCQKIDGTDAGSAEAAFNVLPAVSADTTASLTVTYPDFAQQGGSLPISWQTQNAPAGSKVMVWLDNASGGADLSVLTGSTMQPATGSYTWSVPASLASGVYKIRAYLVPSNYCYPAFTAATCGADTTSKPLSSTLGSVFMVKPAQNNTVSQVTQTDNLANALSALQSALQAMITKLAR